MLDLSGESYPKMPAPGGSALMRMMGMGDWVRNRTHFEDERRLRRFVEGPRGLESPYHPAYQQNYRKSVPVDSSSKAHNR